MPLDSEKSLPRWLEKQADLSVSVGQTLATSCLIASVATEVDTSLVAASFSESGEEIPKRPWIDEQREIIQRLQSIDGLRELLHRRYATSEEYDELSDEWLVGDDDDCRYCSKDELFDAISFEYALTVLRKALAMFN